MFVSFFQMTSTCMYGGDLNSCVCVRILMIQTGGKILAYVY